MEGSTYCATDANERAPLGPASAWERQETRPYHRFTRYGASAFEAAFSLSLDDQGEGVSFSYGELGGRGLGSYAAGLGELGTGFAGLRLRLRARPPATLRVLYRTELLYEEHLSREIALQLGAAFVPVVISYGRGASGGGAPALIQP